MKSTSTVLYSLENLNGEAESFTDKTFWGKVEAIGCAKVWTNVTLNDENGETIRVPQLTGYENPYDHSVTDDAGTEHYIFYKERKKVTKEPDTNVTNTIANENIIHAIFFTSRHKENTTISNFKVRSKKFLTNKSISDPQLKEEFDDFVNNGLPGEMSRMYVSVNTRDNDKIINGVMHRLINVPHYNSTSLNSLAVSIAMSKECATEKKRLFDFDSTDQSELNRFITDLTDRGAKGLEVRNTPNGYAITIDRGVNIRGLVDAMPDAQQKNKKDQGPWKWPNEIVTYKPDDMVLINWSQKPRN